MTKISNLLIFSFLSVIFVLITLYVGIFFKEQAQISSYLFCYETQIYKFFIYYTFLGNTFWIFLMLIFVYLFERQSFKKIFIFLISVGLIVFSLKHFLNLPRPNLYFSEFQLPKIEGIRHLTLNSFPSGHTANAFSIGIVISFFSKKRIFVIIAFLYAVLIALSRVCLFQHFWIDVSIGAFIPVVLGLISLKEKQINEINSKNISRT